MNYYNSQPLLPKNPPPLSPRLYSLSPLSLPFSSGFPFFLRIFVSPRPIAPFPMSHLTLFPQFPFPTIPPSRSKETYLYVALATNPLLLRHVGGAQMVLTSPRRRSRKTTSQCTNHDSKSHSSYISTGVRGGEQQAVMRLGLNPEAEEGSWMVQRMRG